MKNLDLEQDKLPIERALGVHWCVESDTFQFKVIIKDRPFTRRGLSVVSSIYDPLGVLAPVVLTAKMIMQDLSRMKIDWDDDLPERVKQQWAELN